MSKIAEEAAQKAVKETFAMFNVNVEDDESRERFMKDMMFMRDLRKSSEAAKSTAFKTLIGLIITGVSVALWKGLPWGGLP